MRIALLLSLAAACARPHTAPPKGASPAASAEKKAEAVPAPTPPVRTPAELPGIRLSRDVRPIRQKLDLTVDPSEGWVSGVAEIDVEIAVATEWIWLNASGLTIVQAKVGDVEVTPFSSDELLALPVPRPGLVGRAKITLAYKALVPVLGSEGIFRRREGRDWYTFTDFEPMEARRAFPCFDQPELKHPWQITVRIPRDNGAFSNTPIESEARAENGTSVITFRETPPLPSYLVSLAVGPFETLESAHEGAPVRIVFPRGHAAEAAHAAERAGELLTRTEKLFESPFPYEKLDLIAVPALGPGAMENPGLITFRQPLLLNKPEEWTRKRQRVFAAVAAHEMAHQWFGDLVTMEWWDDLWLNESFATWAGLKIVDEWRPEWRGGFEAVDERRSAAIADSLPSVRRIRQPVATKDDAFDAFDAITYDKGAAVLRMFEAWIGEETFRQGVQRYLAKHRHGNATAADFLAAVGEAAGADVATPFSTFLDQAGVPLVTIELDCPGKGAPSLRFTQERLVATGVEPGPPQTWQIPVCVRFGAKEQAARACTLVTAAAQTWTPPSMTRCPVWLVPNADSLGYYHPLPRGDRAVAALSRAVKEMTPEERAGSAIDLLALVKGGRLGADDALAALRVLARDADLDVVDATIDVTIDLGHFLVDATQQARWAAFVRDAYGARAAKLGWIARDGETDGEALVRPRLLGLVAGDGADDALAKQARTLADAWLADRAAVSSEVVDGLLRAAARRGDGALFGRMVEALVAAKDPADRRRLVEAIAHFRDPALTDRQLALFTRTDIDPNDLRWLFRELAKNPAVTEALHAFVREHLEDLRERLPKIAASELPMLVRRVCDVERAEELDAWFRDRIRDIPGATRTLDEVVEEVRICSAVRRAQSAKVTQYLSKYRGGDR